MRINFFAWEAVWVGILTLDQLKRRGKCCWTNAMCKGEEIMVNHILLHCLKVLILWLLIFSQFGIDWVMHCLIRGLFWVDMVFLLERRGRKFRELLLCAIFNHIKEKKWRVIWKYETARSNNQTEILELVSVYKGFPNVPCKLCWLAEL